MSEDPNKILKDAIALVDGFMQKKPERSGSSMKESERYEDADNDKEAIHAEYESLLMEIMQEIEYWPFTREYLNRVYKENGWLRVYNKIREKLDLPVIPIQPETNDWTEGLNESTT